MKFRHVSRVNPDLFDLYVYENACCVFLRLLLRSRRAQSYQMKLQDLIVDSGTVGESADVAEISFRLNDVANFENVGIPVKLVIKGLRLVVAH